MRLPVRLLARYGAAVLIVAGTGLAAELFYRLTGSDRLSVIFLTGVLLSAFLLGSGPAFLTSGLAFVVYLWLVDPRYTFSFGSPEDYNTLFVFLVAAGLTGFLAGRVRDQAAREYARAQTTGSLLDAARDFSASADEGFIRQRLAHNLAVACGGEAVLRDGLRAITAPGETLTRELVLAATDIEKRARAGERGTFHVQGWALRSLVADDQVLGVAAWTSQGLGPTPPADQALLEILVDTGAVAIARARLAGEKAEAEARAQTEDLRNALLSSISHDLRTPLAAILASASSLREYGEDFDGATRSDLAATIEEEASRLDAFVANLLNMTRLEAGAIASQGSALSVPEVVSRVLQRRGRRAQDRMAITLPPGLPPAWGDPTLLEQALGHVVENALRYSPLEAPVAIEAGVDAGRIAVAISDEGPGVPPEDLDRIFQKFFRSAGTSKIQGTGLGLAIARGLLEAMGGSVVARNRQDRPNGLRVTLTLPAAP